MVSDESMMDVNRQAHYYHESWWIGPVASTLVLIIAAVWPVIIERAQNLKR